MRLTSAASIVPEMRTSPTAMELILEPDVSLIRAAAR
jgi:hypothetical protein